MIVFTKFTKESNRKRVAHFKKFPEKETFKESKFRKTIKYNNLTNINGKHF